jgi:hypothetical protein
MRTQWLDPTRLGVIAVCTAALLGASQPGAFSPSPDPSRPAAVAPPQGVAEAAEKASYGPCDDPPYASRDVADDLLANRYTLARFDTVTLPSNPRWNENPLHDPNWEFNFHALRYVEALWAAWDTTGDRRYRDRYEFLLRDWYQDNPRTNPPSSFSWNDHSAAWRGILYACALKRLPKRPWLRAAALLHGRTLADERFYVDHGNHALNQAIGLLALGCEMHDAGWRRLAAKRIEKLVVESVDAEGVTNEQAIGYQLYNYDRYSEAAANLRACGITPSRSLEVRVERMPRFLAFGALPDARWELVGDTLEGRVSPVPGTVAEYVATGGSAGPRPNDPYATFGAGFAFMRSGWGETQRLADETGVCVRFGPERAFHGHRDAAAVTLYANGDRILLDPGMYHFARDAWRTWFRSGRAHNTIDVDGDFMRETGATRLVAERHAAGFDFVSVEHQKISGVDHTRRVMYVRPIDALIVEDDVRMETPHTVRQWWHLHPDARPAFASDGFYTGRPGSPANAWVVQLDGDAIQGSYRGSTDPMQGWVSFDYGKLQPATAVNVAKTGTHVRFFTLIVPSPAKARSWTVRSFEPRSEGFDLVLRIGSTTERIFVRGTTASAALV